MAIDYMINLNCRVKEELGAEAIIDLTKAKVRAEAFLRRFEEQGMSRDEAMEASFGIQVRQPDREPEIERVTVRSMLSQAALLEDFREHCKGCPVSFDRAFGCYQSINYPISAAAEEWLARTAARAISAGMPNSILIQFILDQDVKGERFTTLRGGDEFRYFEAELPVEIEVETMEDETIVVNTSQLMEMFFAISEMGEVHQQFLLFFSGGLTIQNHEPDLSKIGLEYQVGSFRSSEGDTRHWVYRMTDHLSDDRSIRQIKAFLRAVFAAQCSTSTLTVDY